MLSSKLYYILSSFTADDLKEFGKFIHSPFFNSSKNTEKFYDEMKKNKFKFDNKALNQENIYKAIFPNKKFNNGMWRNIISDMSKQAEDFLGYNYFRRNESELQRFIALNFKSKKLDKYYEKKLDSFIENIDNKISLDENDYLEKFQLLIAKREYSESKITLGKRTAIYENISSDVNYVVYYFVTVMLKEYFHILSYKKQINFEQNLQLYKEVMKIVESEKLTEKCILIKILHTFLLFYKVEADDELYYNLKKMIMKNKKVLSENDYKNFCTELYNYSVRRRLKGIDGFPQESMNMLKILVNENIIFTDGYLSAHSYINIVSKAFFEKEFEWAEKFIYNYHNKVIPAHRENAYHYNLSVLNYKKGTMTDDPEEKKTFFIESQRHLIMVKSEDHFYMIKIKKLLLIIYYELKYINNLIYTIDSFSHYLNNNDNILAEMKESNRNFIQMLRKLVRANDRMTKFDKEYLKKQITSLKNLDFRNWLLEKAEELEVK
jgi:hypothetical protein